MVSTSVGSEIITVCRVAHDRAELIYLRRTPSFENQYLMSTEEIISNLKKFLWCYSKSNGPWTLSAPMETKRLRSWIRNHIRPVRQTLGDVTVLFMKKIMDVLKWKLIPGTQNRGAFLERRGEWANMQFVSPHAFVHPSSSQHHNYPELILQYDTTISKTPHSLSLTVQSRACLSRRTRKSLKSKEPEKHLSSLSSQLHIFSHCQRYIDCAINAFI